MENLILVLYIFSAVFFILGIKDLNSPKNARRGNQLAALGMFIAVLATLFEKEIVDYTFIIVGVVVGSAIGAVTAKKVRMAAMPQMVALFNGLGGGASALVALASYHSLTDKPEIDFTLAMIFSLFIGALTFSGSLIAFAKLQELINSAPVVFKLQHLVSSLLCLVSLVLAAVVLISPNLEILVFFIGATALIFGVSLAIRIGGADMPVAIALLNAFSGLAAAATGFVLSNYILIISGALVGASGVILSRLMCEAMNRSLANVIFGTVGGTTSEDVKEKVKRSVTRYTEEDAVMMLESSRSVIIIPGYGLAAAQAQHVLHGLAKILIERGIRVRYAIHPVAGRMPGHMNVLLAEAQVPYDLLCDLEKINDDFQNTDVVVVVGANDIINPVARTTEDKKHPLYRMPILNADKAETVIICKRSLSPGYAGVDNELFYDRKTMMIFGDAKDSLTKMKNLLEK